VDPHINSFNSIFEKGGQLDQAIRDIGTKVFPNGDLNAPEEAPRNRLRESIRSRCRGAGDALPGSSFIESHNIYHIKVRV
jgi:hypothetical protein